MHTVTTLLSFSPILITGAAGFIGVNPLNRLLEALGNATIIGKGIYARYV